MSDSDYPAREEALRRLSEPEGDHELHSALERMRVDQPHLWEVLHRLCTSHTTPTPPSWRSGEGRQRVARRTSGLPIMTRPWESWRWRSSSLRKPE